MKKQSHVFVLALLTFGFFFSGTLIGFSQDKTNDQQPSKTPPKLLKFNETQRVSLQSSNQLLKNVFDSSEKTSFTTIKQEQDKLGYNHQKNQQYYNNVKVEFGTLTLHSKNGMVESISSEFYKIEDLNTSPNISNTQAFNRAISHTGASAYLWEDEAASNELGYSKPEGELVIIPLITEEATTMKLAYKFDIYTISPMGGGDLYIDAQNGQALFFNNKVRHLDNFGHDGRAFSSNEESTPSSEIIVEEFEAIASGTAATRYSGSRTIETSLSGGNYILSDAGRKVYTRNANNLAPVGNSLPYITSYSQFSDSDNNWTAAEYDNSNKDNAALDAHWGAMMTYDYWSTVHGRDSYDANGAQLRSYVHVDNDYDNAFWFLNVMSYGDGSSNGNEGNGYFDALTSIDVAAHEIGHAVTEYTANLAYQRESGGLNEGYSDIWGAAVEHFAKGNGNDGSPDASIWLIGDEIDRRSGSAALRSMSNPTSLGQPDTYGGTYWSNPNCGTPTQSNDYCGVHTNSGVLNYWFYLSVAGGNGTNDIGNAFSVSGIGMTKAANISYRAINTYLSANSTYADARTAMIQSAQDLYGADGAEEQGVTNAWHAVGVGDAYGGGNPPTDCLSGDISLSITFDNYPEETAWTLKNSSGTTVASASYSTSNPDGSTVNETFTGLAVDDYTFTITDAYGDGICCSYGSGSYSLSSSAGSFQTGGSFGSSEATPFCIESGSGGDTEAPTAPTSLSASNITQTTADLSWNASSDNVAVTGYDIYQGSTNIGTVTGTSVQITGLTAATSYSFNVKAKDAAGNESSSSNTVNFTTPSGADTEAPTAPTSLAASNVTQTTADLSWSASSDNVGVTGYDVYQGSTNLGTVTGTSANITGLTAATSYSFSVRAKDAAGNVSSSSNTVNITTLSGADTESPTVPTSLVASNVSQTTVDLSWNASSDNVGVTGYDVYQGASNIMSVTGTSASVTGLTAATAYTFSVIAKDAAGNTSSSSNTVNITTQSAGGGSTVLNEGYFESGWDGWVDGGSDSYRYSGSRSYEGNRSIRLRDNTNSSVMTLSNINVSSYSTIDVEFYFYSYSMENGEDFWVQYHDGLSWNTVATYARGTSFENNNFYSATVTISNASYSFPTNAKFRFRNDASGNNDHIYIDQVTITGNSGSSNLTNSITSLGEMNNILGNGGDEIDFESDFLLYPNPAKSTVSIQLSTESTYVTYRIVNMIGQEVLSGELGKGTINVEKLETGVYFMEVNDGEELMIQRFIKE